MVQRLFFHNKYSQESIDALSELIMDDNTKVISVMDDEEYPQQIVIPHFPYLVDRYFQLQNTTTTFPVGTIILELICKDYNDQPIINEQRILFLQVDNTRFDLNPNSDGTLKIELTSDISKSIQITLMADNYYPSSFLIDVVDDG